LKVVSSGIGVIVAAIAGSAATATGKPLLRGVVHQAAFFV
jgi:hypothetical protein